MKIENTSKEVEVIRNKQTKIMEETKITGKIMCYMGIVIHKI